MPGDLPFINDDETAVIEYIPIGCKSMTLLAHKRGPFQTVDELLQAAGDFLRAEVVEAKEVAGDFTDCRPITEECARHWLEGRTDDPEKMGIPAFVYNSEAFDRYCESYYTTNGVSNGAIPIRPGRR